MNRSILTLAILLTVVMSISCSVSDRDTPYIVSNSPPQNELDLPNTTGMEMTEGFDVSPGLIDNSVGGFRTNDAFCKMRLYFIENQGQLHEDVGFYIQGSEKTLYFTPQGVTYALNGRTTDGETTQRWVVKQDFIGSNRDVLPRGEESQSAVVSYFRGTREDWHTNLPTYGRIVYPDLWPGIDLVYSGTVNKLKYEFVVRPGADPEQIRLAYRGATNVTLEETGELMVETPFGGFEDAAPYAYQNINGQHVEISMAYALDEGSIAGVFEYGFDIGPYDSAKPLILDPYVLVYSGYIGGSGVDMARGIAVDESGNAYVTGYTSSADFPVVGGLDDSYNGNGDAFVAKVDATGASLIYCGYIGGTSSEVCNDIAVDESGNAYVTGYTTSFTSPTYFPVVGGPDISYNGGFSDAFVAKLNADGTSLLYCGYIGGSGEDEGNGIAVDRNGCACVTGYTSSTDFPVVNGPDNSYNGGSLDAFVARVNADGSSLSQCSYIGGSGDDKGTDIAVFFGGGFPLQHVYVTGYTSSTDFPVNGAPYPNYNGGYSDAFITSVTFQLVGPLLGFSSYIGGSGMDEGYGIAVDESGNVYLSGCTKSSDFPVISGPGTYSGNWDAYVAKLAWNTVYYSGYIGGSDADKGYGIAVDESGCAHVTGLTSSTDFPVVLGPYTSHSGRDDAFVAHVAADGKSLVRSGYLGGALIDIGYDIAVDCYGNDFVTGCTNSPHDENPPFPLKIGPDATYNGGNYDAFVAKVPRLMAPILVIKPYQNEVSVSRNYGCLSVKFHCNMEVATINAATLKVNGLYKGYYDGFVTYDSDTRTATFCPEEDFEDGEVVTMVLTPGIKYSDGSPMEKGCGWSFTIAGERGRGAFEPDFVYPAGDEPLSVFAADFDNDGDTDLATANWNSNSVSILLNNGDGTFFSYSSHSVGNAPRSVFAGDFDGDGDLDLATANVSSDNVSILMNNGDGTFTSHASYPVGDAPRSVFAADLDCDGKLDLATANNGSHDIAVLFNYGGGNFALDCAYPVGGYPNSVIAADIDGDYDLDLVTSSGYHNSVYVLLNEGNGTFAPYSSYPLGASCQSVLTADLDRDGDLDLATANSNSHDVSILLNNGYGAFGAPLAYTVGMMDPQSILAADLDGDGNLDLATANHSSDYVSVLRNYGGGTFAARSVYHVGDGPSSVVAADLDGDGHLDLATTNRYSGNVSVLLNKGSNEAKPPFPKRDDYSLSQNSPNPFNPITWISYYLLEPCHVSLTIYNVLGQKVKTLANENQAQGHKTVQWDGRNQHGNELASGIYFYRLEAGRHTEVKKMVLLR